MPDRPHGYVKRKEGLLPQDFKAAQFYREQQTDTVVIFTEEHQMVVMESILSGAKCPSVDVHSIATDTQHAHILTSWKDTSRTWLAIRNAIKRRVTIDLKEKFGKRRWLLRGASRRRVRDRKHFDHLSETYLPSHRGWKWSEKLGYFK